MRPSTTSPPLPICLEAPLDPTAEVHEVHALSLRASVYVSDPYRAHERVLARLAQLRARRA